MLVTIEDKSVELSDEQVDLFHRLTRLQQGMVIATLDGKSPADSHRIAGGTCKNEENRTRLAGEVMRNPSVIEFIESVKPARTERLAAVIMSRDEMALELNKMATMKLTGADLGDPTKLADVSEVIIDPDGGIRYKLTSPADRRASMKQLAELMGYNKPQEIKVTADVTSRTKLDDFYGPDA